MISIKEGGKEYHFEDVKMLKVPKSDGTYWVAEKDYKLGYLYEHVNGSYIPTSEHYAYSQATAIFGFNINNTDINIDGLGNPSIGYGGVLATIDANGLYHIKIEDFEFVYPDEDGNYYMNADGEEIPLTDIGDLVEPISLSISGGDSGGDSGSYNINFSDYNTTVTVSYPAKTVTQSEPVMIVIEQPPNKTVYHKGEEIDLTGIVVRAYKADGTTWDIPQEEWTLPNGEKIIKINYPDGLIPTEELFSSWSKNHIRGEDFRYLISSTLSQYNNSPINTYGAYIDADAPLYRVAWYYNGGTKREAFCTFHGFKQGEKPKCIPYVGYEGGQVLEDGYSRDDIGILGMYEVEREGKYYYHSDQVEMNLKDQAGNYLLNHAIDIISANVFGTQELALAYVLGGNGYDLNIEWSPPSDNPIVRVLTATLPIVWVEEE